jgi:hypothetical protein
MPSYGEFPGEVGRVVPRLGLRNDPVLFQRKYIEDFIGRVEDLVPCENCGAMFETYFQRDAHVRKMQHSQTDGHVVSHSSPDLARTPEMEAKIASPTSMNDTEPGGFIAQLGEADQFGRTVPAEYSENRVVRETAKRKPGRPRKTT